MASAPVWRRDVEDRLNAPAIGLKELTVVRGGMRAVEAVSLTVPASSWFGLIGAIGSGKTSLLRALAGRLPSTIASCTLSGVELADCPEERAKLLGFMPPSELLPAALTGRQALSLSEPNESRWLKNIDTVADALALNLLLDRRIGDCSAGMRQRIAIACAFASGGRIVALDEPFNWLDPVATVDLRLALRRWVEQGNTLVTALQDMFTLAACDCGALLADGHIVVRLDPEEVRRGKEDPFDFEARMINRLRGSSSG